jgi:RHS repeat-associated protein
MPSGNAVSIVFNQAYYPYGDEVYSQSFDPGYKFTGYERDPETELDYAFARYYNYRLGRLMSGDPGPRDLSDPQTENRYAYVQNNPTNMTDPSGLCGGAVFGFVGDPWFGSSAGFSGGGDGEGGGGGGISFGVGWGEDPWWCGSDRQPPIYMPPAPHNAPNPFSGETAGIPNGLSIPLQNPLSFLMPTDPSCEFGVCGGVINPFTGQVGISVHRSFWGWAINFAAGIAIDLHFHIAVYHTEGAERSVGASVGGGVQVGVSNADTVCGLRGPFGNASGTLGVEGVGGTVDVFMGSGDGPGGIVTGGTITFGPTEGLSGSLGGTYTTVKPIGSPACGN